MNRRQQEERTYISLRVAVRRSGLTQEIVQECVRREIVGEPLREEDLVKLRRIRRLRELGINMPGIEVILHMRRRILTLQTEMERRQGSGPGRNRTSWIEMEEHWQHLLPPNSDG